MAARLSVVRIADAPEGQVVQVEGVVRALGPLLTAPISDKPCVYFEVRDGVLADHAIAEREQQARDFLVDDDSGSALVVMQRYEVTLVARAHQQMLSALGADINQVAARLRRLKETMRDADARTLRQLGPQRERLRELATYLCTLRAHARGRVHGGTRSLTSQSRWLRENHARFAGDDASHALPDLPTMAWEIALEPGQRVTVQGFARWEPDPDPSAAVGGYRQRPLRLCLRAPTDAPLSISTMAARIQQREAQRAAEQRVDAALSRHQRPRRRRALLWLALAAAGAAGALAYLL